MGGDCTLLAEKTYSLCIARRLDVCVVCVLKGLMGLKGLSGPKWLYTGLKGCKCLRGIKGSQDQI